jgi:hypothetical protein
MSETSSEDTSRPKEKAVPLDQLALASLAALIARWHLAWHRKEIQDAIAAKAKEEAARQLKVIHGCREACIALGYNPEDKVSWAPMLEDVYPVARAIFNKNRPADIPPWGVEAPQIEESKAKTPPPTPSEMPRISDIILERLREAGEKGQKAANIRQFISKTYSTEIHEKTVGMTLYRLLKRKDVRRNGHTWFIAPKAMNPGAATPGPSQSQEES